MSGAVMTPSNAGMPEGDIFVYELEITTNASGACTVSTPWNVNGELACIEFINTDLAASGTLSLHEKDSELGATLKELWAYTLPNPAANKRFYPVAQISGQDGSAISAQYARIPVADQLELVVASGGDTKTGKLRVYIKAG